ncbi:MAG: hypothetical protein QMC85_06590 [Methanocellales archaeon]|nr:hypothetical protein [Methanocellales archaeon]
MPEIPKKGHLKKGMVEKLKFADDKDITRPRSSLTGKRIKGTPIVAWVDGPAKRTIRIESRSKPDRPKYYILFADGPADKRLNLSEEDLAEIIEGG